MVVGIAQILVSNLIAQIYYSNVLVSNLEYLYIANGICTAVVHCREWGLGLDR